MNQRGWECLSDGLRAEEEFITSATKNEMKFVRYATKYEDINEHWDLLFKYKNNEIRVDVKNHKKSGSKKGLLNDAVWVEFKNVKGNNGWLYGKSDYIAFKHYKRFLMYKTDELAERCEKLVNFNNKVYKTSEAYYNLYIGRQLYKWNGKERKDETSIIKLSDLDCILRKSLPILANS